VKDGDSRVLLPGKVRQYSRSAGLLVSRSRSTGLEVVSTHPPRRCRRGLASCDRRFQRSRAPLQSCERDTRGRHRSSCCIAQPSQGGPVQHCELRRSRVLYVQCARFLLDNGARRDLKAVQLAQDRGISDVFYVVAPKATAPMYPLVSPHCL